MTYSVTTLVGRGGGGGGGGIYYLEEMVPGTVEPISELHLGDGSTLLISLVHDNIE